jgi:hypothetical protein
MPSDSELYAASRSWFADKRWFADSLVRRRAEQLHI